MNPGINSVYGLPENGLNRYALHSQRPDQEVQRVDYILVGGGLQSGLMALAISHHQPQASWILIEQQEKLAGNHTWSFHATDIPESCGAWAEPLAECVATNPADRLPQVLGQLGHEHAWRSRFARFLNRLLFELVKPQTRYQIFRRFYRVLDEPAIARFYGHRFTPLDAFRIVVGIPPMGLRPFQFLRSYTRIPPARSAS